MGRLEQCRLVELPKIVDPRGKLTFIEQAIHVPFQVKRVFYIYDVPAGVQRGSHAHQTTQEFLVCLFGGFNVTLDDGFQKKTIELSRPWQGLYVPSMIWASESNFVRGSICMVLASEIYQVSKRGYYRDYSLFQKAVSEQISAI